MDRERLFEHLKLAERHVAEGERVLEHQRAIVEHLRRDGHSGQLIREAERLLRTFREVQSMHVADAARLRQELLQTR